MARWYGIANCSTVGFIPRFRVNARRKALLFSRFPSNSAGGFPPSFPWRGAALPAGGAPAGSPPPPPPPPPPLPPPLPPPPPPPPPLSLFFFFHDTATTDIYTLSLHDALPINLHSATFTLDGAPSTAAMHVEAPLLAQ